MHNDRSRAVEVPSMTSPEELLRSFAGDEEVIMASAHCVLPVRSLG
ncbi:DUF5949 family protein [Streptomyces sp. NPDC057557]